MRRDHVIRISDDENGQSVCSTCRRPVYWTAFETGEQVAALTYNGPEIRNRVVAFLRHAKANQ